MTTAVALLLLAVPAAQAGGSSPLTPGTRIRVTVRDAGAERTYVGPLRTFDGQSLTLVPAGGGNHVALSRASITRIEVSNGTRRRAGLGLLIGAATGLAVLALKEAACSDDCEPSDNYATLVGIAVGGGALAGAGVGAMVRSERWEPLPWAVGPGRRAGPPAAGIRITLRF